MRKYSGIICVLALLTALFGCGDNKTKEKLIGTTVISGSGASYTSNPAAASMTALYKVAFAGAGAGDFSYSGAPRRSPSAAPSGDDGIGLGTLNADGEYVQTDAALGMTVKVKFMKGGQPMCMKFDNAFGATGLYMYAAQNVTSTKYSLAQGTDPNDIMAVLAAGGFTGKLYIPSVLAIATGSQPPADWYEVTYAKMTDPNPLNDLEAFMTSSSFPTSMVNTVSGSIPGGTMSMTMTTAMPSGRPTDAAPVSMSGTGTITFTSGEAWTVTASMQVGESGPVSGTQTFTSSNGTTTGTLTFLNGAVTGVIQENGVTVATMSVNADGTGTFTDLTTDTTYDISDAKPS